MNIIKKIFNFTMDKFGLIIIKSKHYDKTIINMYEYESSHRLLKILGFCGFGSYSNLVAETLEISKLSKSQLSQDMFVLIHLDYKRNGYFVEFGATNGVELSNTWLLKKNFGWKGILAEPAMNWHHDLIKNRSCNIEKKAVWINSDETLSFLESTIPELSTIDQFRDIDNHSRKGYSYEVETISLQDLLRKYDAPKIIDYLSIDTEGSELDILKNFDFEKYKFKVITVEHNFTKNRQKIKHLLSLHGYKQVLEDISSWDDWYIQEGI